MNRLSPSSNSILCSITSLTLRIAGSPWLAATRLDGRSQQRRVENSAKQTISVWQSSLSCMTSARPLPVSKASGGSSMRSPGTGRLTPDMGVMAGCCSRSLVSLERRASSTACHWTRWAAGATPSSICCARASATMVDRYRMSRRQGYRPGSPFTMEASCCTTRWSQFSNWRRSWQHCFHVRLNRTLPLCPTSPASCICMRASSSWRIGLALIPDQNSSLTAFPARTVRRQRLAGQRTQCRRSA